MGEGRRDNPRSLNRAKRSSNSVPLSVSMCMIQSHSYSFPRRSRSAPRVHYLFCASLAHVLDDRVA